MKNFSDLLDTDIQISVSVAVSPVADNGMPTAQIKINNHTWYYDTLESTTTVTCQIPLLDPVVIEIGLSNKSYDQFKETAIIIDSVCIDNFEIVPNFTHLAHYQNERNIDDPTAYLGFNGTWKLSIPGPFYQWHHAVTGQGWLLAPVVNLPQ
jgi:hypothetical protein